MMKSLTAGIVLLLMLFVHSPLFAQEKIILATQNWPPYQTINKGVVGGSAVELVRNAMDRIQLPYEIQLVSWARAQAMVKDGRAHGFFSASRNNQRDSFAVLSTPIAEQKWNWYSLKGSSLVPTSGTFHKQARVTAMYGSNMLSWLKANSYTIKGAPYDTEALIRLLLNKRVDAILANDKVINEVLIQQNISPANLTPYLVCNKPLGVYWSKNFLNSRPDFLRRFNRSIQELRASALIRSGQKPMENAVKP